MRYSVLASILFLFVACGNATPPESPVAPAAPAPPAADNTPAPAPVASELPQQPAPAPPVAPLTKRPVKKSTPPAPPPVAETIPATPAPEVPTPASTGQSIGHATLDSLLQKHVSNTGVVSYKGLKTDKVALDAYCQWLSDNPVPESAGQAEKMAYWINAYNAFTLKLIVDNYPTKSIINFDGGKTWDVRRIRIGDKKYSLNNIENDILRPLYKDARIHFAINCAAKSCPPLWNHAYTAENLEATLESRTRQFINDAQYNTIGAKSAEVSKIFDWYSVDFGNLRSFLNRYASVPIGAGVTIRFQEYDWALNDR